MNGQTGGTKIKGSYELIFDEPKRNERFSRTNKWMRAKFKVLRNSYPTDQQARAAVVRTMVHM